MEESQSTSIVANAHEPLAALDNLSLSVGDLERALLEMMPSADACSWDRTGMLVGDPYETVRAVCVALDPTIMAVEATAGAGANVLVCHHPVFLDAPESFLPAVAQGSDGGSVVRRAIETGVSIMSFHTALDVSREGLEALPALLHLNGTGVLEPLATDTRKGFGRICEPFSSETEPLTLRRLAARCVSVFGSIPRVWGNPDMVVRRVCTSGGSAGSFAKNCINAGIDVLICGEIKYHDALNAAADGLAIIEMGHDISEQPLCALLAAHIGTAGVPESCITMFERRNWYTPESLRR